MGLKDHYSEAKRSALLLRMEIFGPNGSGKTHTALQIARKVVGPDGDILVLDTETGGSEGGRSSNVVGFNHYISPFNTLKQNAKTVYDDFRKAFESGVDAGADCIIVDSFSHETLFYLMQAEATGDNSSYYKTMKPKRRNFLDAIANSPVHVILCTRSEEQGVQDPNATRLKIVRMAIQPVSSAVDMPFNMDFRVAMEDMKARVVKTIDNIIVPEGRVYDVVRDDELETSIITVMDDGNETKQRFTYQLRERGFIGSDALNKLWSDLPELGAYEVHRHSEMLSMVDNFMNPAPQAMVAEG
jgi:RecA/RadA recombinase